MARIYNFGAGPATLPEAVLRQAAGELADYRGCGMSVMEMSHRGEVFTGIATRAEADLRELLGIPANYRVLFLQGGASLQFSAVPMNLLRGRGSADYVNTGHWSERAIAEARRYCRVNVAASGAARNFTHIPPQPEWRLDPGAAYVHYTPNETIGGVEFHWVPDTAGVPLVADMSSNILSRPLDIGRFGLIYAGAQKNVGPAGLTLVIVREDLLAEPLPGTPTLLDYRVQAEHGSMYNTPPTFAIYLAGLVFQWLKEQGGLAAMEARNLRKAQMLYDCLDRSAFFRCPVDPACRSRMNVPFALRDTSLEKPFLEEAESRGLSQLRGHRAVGGMRASIYNAMPEEGVAALVDFLHEFEARHG